MAKHKKVAASALFLEVFGSGVTYREYTKQDDARLASRIPQVMRDLLIKDGWCSYKDQLLWLCDPDQWELAARAWFPDTPNAQILLRSAFGDLCIWDGTVFWYVMVHESVAMMTVSDADWFFSQMLTDDNFALRNYLPERVRVAREVAGTLEEDQMYTYVPAIALGGSEQSSKIERVKALEAIIMLAKMAPIQRI